MDPGGWGRAVYPVVQGFPCLSEIPVDRLWLEALRRRKREKLYFEWDTIWTPENPIGVYPWQARFCNAGKDNGQRLLMKANRVGGTTCAAAEIACHLTGLYPSWWEGRKFDTAVHGWAGGESSQAVRDVVQEALLGPVAEWGTGWIPGDKLAQRPKLQQAGVHDVADVISVIHRTGGISTLGLKTYEQGRTKWQGKRLDFVWLDEQPPVDIFTEALTRIVDSNGLLIMTFTPLKGVDDVVKMFLDAERPGVYVQNVTWDDAPHLNAKARAEALLSYPEHERETRTTGTPMLGTGVVFPVKDEMIAIEPFEIPRWWTRINGVDFGIDHPAAGAFCAHDKETDTFYVYDCYKMAGHTPIYHAAAMKKYGDRIPIAWPQDGLVRDKGSGEVLKNLYRQQGLYMLPDPAAYKNEWGQHVEPGLIEMLQYMRLGKFKVFRTLSQWFEERRMYHREDGAVVKKFDDIISATRYAFISRRLAKVRDSVIPRKIGPKGPVLGMRRWKG